MLNLILFGPPGSGKGTQADKLVEKYGLIHISTGDLFRYEMKNDTDLGKRAKEYMAKGELVPDEVTVGMLRNRVDQSLDAKGFIFDGFPRTIPQAEALDALLKERGTGISGLLHYMLLTRRLLTGYYSAGRHQDGRMTMIQGLLKTVSRYIAVRQTGLQLLRYTG